MTATICGHNRETLRWLLSERARLGTQGYTLLKVHAHVKPHLLRYPDAAEFVGDIEDPAKLAAIIAELMRERDIETTPKSGELTFWSFTGERQRLIRYAIELPLYIANTWRIVMLTMPQARTFALALLDAPQTTTQDIERMIGEIS